MEGITPSSHRPRLAPILTGLLASAITMFAVAGVASWVDAAGDRADRAEFELERARVVDLIGWEIRRHLTAFDAVATHLEISHPAANDDLMAFGAAVADADRHPAWQTPVAVIEEVPAADRAELVDRERALGASDFALIGSPAGAEGPRQILIRSAAAPGDDNIVFRGLDLTDVGADVGLELPWSEGGTIISALPPLAVDLLLPRVDETGLDDPTMSDIRGSNVIVVRSLLIDERRTWLVQPADLGGLVTNVIEKVPQQLAVDVAVESSLDDDVVASFGPIDAPTIHRAEPVTLEAAGLDWSIEVRSTDALVVAPLHGDHVRLAGLVVAVLVGVLVAGRAAARARLAATEGALEVAHDAAERDPLTGLLNRSGLTTRAEHWAGTAAVVLLDLDGFKDVNDHHGHAEGDRVLCIVARCLEATFRSDDVVARLGGDEFAVLTRADRRDADLATSVVERVERALAERQGLLVDASIGVAVADLATEGLSAALDRADRAMYEAKRAKRAGRSQVTRV